VKERYDEELVNEEELVIKHTHTHKDTSKHTAEAESIDDIYKERENRNK
jgi:hypothetical protein